MTELINIHIVYSFSHSVSGCLVVSVVYFFSDLREVQCLIFRNCSIYFNNNYVLHIFAWWWIGWSLNVKILWYLKAKYLSIYKLDPWSILHNFSFPFILLRLVTFINQKKHMKNKVNKFRIFCILLANFSWCNNTLHSLFQYQNHTKKSV